MSTNRKPVTVSHIEPLAVQQEAADRLHHEDITHIITAESEFATLFPAADTLIWLRVPSASAVSKMTCAGAVYPTNWLLQYNSAALRTSGFDKFSELLDNERYQKRKASDLMMSGLIPPSKFDMMNKFVYVLDLGPSTDCDLRSEHLEALSLPMGILRYSMLTRIAAKKRVPICTAGGHDDACRCFRLKLGQAHHNGASPGISDSQLATGSDRSSDSGDTSLHTSSPNPVDGPASQTPIGTLAPGLDANTDQPNIRLPSEHPGGELSGSIWDLPVAPEFAIDDYCEIRHVANVIRLLLAITGRPLLLNSAARVYTLAGLAKLFGLRSSDGYYDGNSAVFRNHGKFDDRLRAIFMDWFYTRNNTLILDVLPEESLVIAWNLKLSSITRATYRILVAERALQDAMSSSMQPRKSQSRQRTVFGRELSGLLDDDIETMLDHASEALINRTQEAWDTYMPSIDTTKSASTAAARPQAPHSHESTSKKPNGYTFLEPLINNRSSVFSKLMATSKVLEEFAHRGRDLVQGIPNADDQISIQLAINSIRDLMDKISTDIQDSFPRGMPDTDLLVSSYSHSILECLSLYVRQSLLHGNFVGHVYNHLPENQKRMTAIFWDHFTRTTRETLQEKQADPSFTALLRGLCENLQQALQLPVLAEDNAAVTAFRVDLARRLQGVGLHSSPYVSRPDEVELYLQNSIRDELHQNVLSLYDSSWGRDNFLPELDLSWFNPSPHLLLKLSENEFRFLPLWAGGDNDGTGAVYEPALPIAELGPISPGPAYHTGTTNVCASTIGANDSRSVSGPPSISDAATDRFTDAGLSDAGTDQGGSVSSSFILVRHLNSLDLASEQASSVFGGAASSNIGTNNTFSSHASRQAHDGCSSISGQHSAVATPSVLSTSSAAISSPFNDLVLIEAEHLDCPTPSNDRAHATVATGDDDDYDDSYGDGEFDFDNEDDADIEDQEHYDDDDENADARSDDTVMPDREEVEQAMRLDAQLQQGGGSNTSDGKV